MGRRRRAPARVADRGCGAGRLAVVTEIGGAASVTESAGRIWAELADRLRAFTHAARAQPGARVSASSTQKLGPGRIGADGHAAILHLRPNKSEGIVDRNCKININEACRNSIRNARPVHAAHIALKQLNSLGVMQAQYFTG